MKGKSLSDVAENKIKAALQADPELLQYFESEFEPERMFGIISQTDKLKLEDIKNLIKIAKEIDEGESDSIPLEDWFKENKRGN